MKLSTKARYAIMALCELVKQSQSLKNKALCANALSITDSNSSAPNFAISLSSIAQAQHLSLTYLEQLFNLLRKHQIVNSVRGTKGGYALARAASLISIYDIVLATDAPVKMTRCVMNDPKGCMQSSQRCVTHTLWRGLEKTIQAYLTQINLEQVSGGDYFQPVVTINHTPNNLLLILNNIRPALVPSLEGVRNLANASNNPQNVANVYSETGVI